MGLSMAAIEQGFDKSLCQALSGINLENVSLHAEQKQAIRNIIFFKERHQFFISLGKSCVFQLSPFAFDSWHSP